MIYTPMTRRAMVIAYEAHAGQTDKSGLPYIHHPLHLAEQMDSEAAVCAALLHDVVEDTDMTFERLEGEGFAPEVLAALRLLTHDEDVPYLDYVRALKADPIAAAVKRADLRHNSDLTRLDTVDEKALARVEKYKAALKLLEE